MAEKGKARKTDRFFRNILGETFKELIKTFVSVLSALVAQFIYFPFFFFWPLKSHLAVHLVCCSLRFELNMGYIGLLG